MPRNASTNSTRPEFSWEEDRQMWRKRAMMPDGKYHNVRAPTKRELKQKIADTEREITDSIQAKHNITVAECAQKWYALKKPNLEHNGAEAIRNAVENHIIPEIGSSVARDVKPEDIDRLLNTLGGKSSSLRTKVLSAIRRTFDYAVENGYADRNPCDKRRAGGRSAGEKTPLSDEQAVRLLSALDNDRARRAYVFCAIGLYTGMRREEILGLAWDCVKLDVAHPCISVEYAVHFEGQRGIRADNLKTKAARRVIPIPPELASILRDEKQGSQSALVVADSKGNVCSRTSLRNIWGLVENRMVGKTPEEKRHPYCEKTIDFDVTPHILRHTYITNLCLHSAETGLDIKTIQYLAGHADPVITLKIYAHAVNNKPEDIARKINKTFSCPNRCPDNLSGEAVIVDKVSDNR